MNGVQLLLIIVGGIAVAGLAHRKGVQPGVVIVVLAAGASFIPGVPRLELDSELILAVVVPPLLYSATRGASISGFTANLRPILSLGVVLVVITTGAAGWVATLLLPAIGVPAAFTLGAILAPPDTITTVTHGDEIGLPRRATAILTGESLVNDATALTLFSLAVAAAGGKHTVVGNAFGLFAYNTVVGLVIGGILAAATLWLRKRLRNATLETSVALLVPFTAFLTAEQLHASGVLAVVVAAFSISLNTTFDGRHQTAESYRTRLQEEAFWPVIDFVMETFVFAYIGLQLKFVLSDLREARDLGITVLTAVLVLLTVIVVRLVCVSLAFGRWALADRFAARRRQLRSLLGRGTPDERPEVQVRPEPAERPTRQSSATGQFERTALEKTGPEKASPEKAGIQQAGLQQARLQKKRRPALGAPTGKETLIVGWTGMRGILTLAAAAAVPATTSAGAPFPGRDAIQGIALFVTLGTLLVQGTTVRWLVHLLKIDTAAERAESAELRRRGTTIAADAGSRTATPTDRDFATQRKSLSEAVATGDLDDRTARDLIHDIDLRQAAAETA